MKFYLDNTEDIFLYQLLKAAGAVEEYAHIRKVITEGEIKVNHQTVFKQRTRIFPGDEVVFKEMHIKVVAGKTPAERPPKPETPPKEEHVKHGRMQKWHQKPLKKQKDLQHELATAATKLHNHLLNNKKSLGLAESCTGGMAGSLLTTHAGSSSYFLGSVVCYSNQVKMDYLSVNKKTLEEFGAVSGNTAVEMSLGILDGMRSDLSGAITGIAGPAGGEPGKPVGTVYIAVHHSEGKKTVKRFQFKGSREEIRKQSCLELFKLLYRVSSAGIDQEK